MSERPFLLRPLGQTGLLVPPLCIGLAELGNMPETFAYEVTEPDALGFLRALFHGPIPFADTAASYGDGESERRIGVVLREMGGLPPGFVLATKADRNLTTGDFSGNQMRHSVERSLSLLGVDHLDICFLHDPEYTTFDAAMAPDGPVAALRQLQDAGIIRHLGIAGGPIDMMIRYIATDLFALAVSHNRFTLLNQEAAPLWDACARHGVTALNAAPYGSGILAKGPRAYPRYMYGAAADDLIQLALCIEALCQEYGVPLPAAALQFSLREPRIAATIVGVSKTERLHQTVELAQHPIPEALWPAIAALQNAHLHA